MMNKKALLCLPVIMLLAQCILPDIAPASIQKDKTREVLFHVKLSRQVVDLLAKVEHLYGKEVREEWLKADDRMIGEADVGEDGTPIIWIHPTRGRKIAVIFHELHHFIQRDQGYPTIMWIIPPTRNNEQNRTLLHQFATAVYDPILHYIFYPDARKLGIDPGETFEEITKETLKDKSLDARLHALDKESIGVYYFKILLEVKDQTVLQEVTQLLERKQKQEGLALGRKLAQIVIDSKPDSPEKAIEAFILCLNSSFDRQLNFKLSGWTMREQGKHKRKSAQITVTFYAK